MDDMLDALELGWDSSALINQPFVFNDLMNDIQQSITAVAKYILNFQVHVNVRTCWAHYEPDSTR